jgi:hypothetical protein
MPMKFAADSSEPTTPVTKSTNGSVAMRMSSAILYSGFFAGSPATVSWQKRRSESQRPIDQPLC